MDTEGNTYATPQQPTAGAPSSASATAQHVLERGAKVYGQAEQAVSDAYDKTVQAVSETYEKVKGYSTENPGRTVLVALGIGVGLGFLLGANSRRSRTSRFAQPLVNALSDFALEFFR